MPCPSHVSTFETFETKAREENGTSDASSGFQTALLRLTDEHRLEVGALKSENMQLQTEIDSLKETIQYLHGCSLCAYIDEPQAQPNVASVANEVASWRTNGSLSRGGGAEDATQEQEACLSLSRHSSTVQQNGKATDEFGTGDAAAEIGSSAGSAAKGNATQKVLDVLKSPKAAELRMSLHANEKYLLPSKETHHRKLNNMDDLDGHRSYRSLGCLKLDHRFDLACAIIVVINAIVFGLEVEMAAMVPGGTQWTHTLAHICNALFFGEVAIRLFAQGKDCVLDRKERGWNLFDLVFLIAMLFDYVVIYNTAIDIPRSVIDNVEMVRIIRVVRMIRFFRFSRDLGLLALMVMESLRSLAWALIMLAIIIYIFAVLFTEAFSRWQSRGLDSDHSAEEVEAITASFGNLESSGVSLIQTMLSGQSWYIFSHQLWMVGWWATALFYGYVLFTMLAVLNVVTGVFVDNAVQLAHTQREFVARKEAEFRHQHIKEMGNLFALMDSDGSGSVSLLEIQECFADPLVIAFFSALDLDIGDAEHIFQLIDSDDDGELGIQEFIDGCMKLKGGARSLDVFSVLRGTERLQRRLSSLEKFVDNMVQDHRRTYGTLSWKLLEKMA